MSLVFSNIELLRLVVDALLSVSLVLCAFAWRRRGSEFGTVKKMAELEGAIRELILEAEQASRRVQEDLAVRKKDLEFLLQEIRAAEDRLHYKKTSDLDPGRPALDDFVVASGDHPNTSAGLGRVAGGGTSIPGYAKYDNASDSMSSPSDHFGTIRPPLVAAADDSRQSQGSLVRAQELWQQEPIAPTFRAAMRPFPGISAEASLKGATIKSDIAGTSAATPAAISSTRGQSLRGQVEKIIGPDLASEHSSSLAGGRSSNGMSEVIAAADGMLQRGIDGRTVARLTGLPLEQIEFLSAVIKDEQMTVSRDDPRLGVLASY